MRRAFPAVVILLLLGVGATAALLRESDEAPVPTTSELERNGFAVWPADTVEEGLEECEEAEAWHLDPRETAFKFVTDVLNYPEPEFYSDPIPDEEVQGETRYIIGSKGVAPTFLGSVVDVRKYGRCWFVVYLEPREGNGIPPTRFVSTGEGSQLIIRSLGTGWLVHVGYGSWEEQVRADGRAVVDLPDLEPDATGHFMALSNYQGVMQGTAAPLGFVPEPSADP